MTFEIWAALAVVCITVYGLLKRWETRLVLLTHRCGLFGDGFRPSDEPHRV